MAKHFLLNLTYQSRLFWQLIELLLLTLLQKDYSQCHKIVEESQNSFLTVLFFLILLIFVIINALLVLIPDRPYRENFPNHRQDQAPDNSASQFLIVLTLLNH